MFAHAQTFWGRAGQSYALVGEPVHQNIRLRRGVKAFGYK
jgi:hypothetical protein